MDAFVSGMSWSQGLVTLGVLAGLAAVAAVVLTWVAPPRH